MTYEKPLKCGLEYGLKKSLKNSRNKFGMQVAFNTAVGLDIIPKQEADAMHTIEKNAQKDLVDMKMLLQDFLKWEEQVRVRNPEQPLPELGDYLLQKQTMIASIQALLQTRGLAGLFREDFFKQYPQAGFSAEFLTLRQEVRQLFMTIGAVLTESIQQLDQHKDALRKELESLQAVRAYVQNCRATLLPARQMEFSE